MRSPRQAPTTEQFTAFQKQFDYFNRVLFGKALPSVLLNFSRKANTYGFFAPDRWKDSDGTSTHEISLNPAYLAERAAEATSSTIVHEMVHLWQHEHGTPSRRGYHNEQWAAKMRDVGLMPSSTGKPGGDWVGYAVSHYIVEGGSFERAFQAMSKAHTFPWQSTEPTGAGRAMKVARNKVKYTCPSCNVNAWGKPDLNLVCGDDKATFEAQKEGRQVPENIARGRATVSRSTRNFARTPRLRHGGHGGRARFSAHSLAVSGRLPLACAASRQHNVARRGR
jgi:predicted SprT family Zn-dependent metalloprotease